MYADDSHEIFSLNFSVKKSSKNTSLSTRLHMCPARIPINLHIWSVFPVLLKVLWILCYPQIALHRLIRLCACACWSESQLGTYSVFITKTCPFNDVTIYGGKNEKFQMKKCDLFVIFAWNRDCGYTLEPPHRGGSNAYPQSLFLAEIRKIMYTPADPIYYLKVEFERGWGVKIT